MYPRKSILYCLLLLAALRATAVSAQELAGMIKPFVTGTLVPREEVLVNAPVSGVSNQDIVPSALAVGPGGEFHTHAAIAGIGGLLLSTMLSQVFVPSLFSVINGLKSRLRKRLVSVLGNNQSTSQAGVQPGSQEYQNA